MRSLLSGGIKAILAIAALSTAAHWTLRLQREPAGLGGPVLASLPEPEATGSIAPRDIVRPQTEQRPAAPLPVEPRRAATPAATPAGAMTSAKPAETARAPAAGLDQSHLAALIATAGTAPKPKPAKR